MPAGHITRSCCKQPTDLVRTNFQPIGTTIYNSQNVSPVRKKRRVTFRPISVSIFNSHHHLQVYSSFKEIDILAMAGRVLKKGEILVAMKTYGCYI